MKHVSDLHHPRKVGLSDAYLFTHTILSRQTVKLISLFEFDLNFVSALSRRVIYEYHRVEVQLDNVKSGAVVVIKANPGGLIIVFVSFSSNFIRVVCLFVFCFQCASP